MSERLGGFFSKIRQAVNGPEPRERIPLANYEALVKDLADAMTREIKKQNSDHVYNVAWGSTAFDSITMDHAKKMIEEGHDSDGNIARALEVVQDTKEKKIIVYSSGSIAKSLT